VTTLTAAQVRAQNIDKAMGHVKQCIANRDAAVAFVRDAEDDLKKARSAFNRADVALANARNDLIKVAPELIAGYVPNKSNLDEPVDGPHSRACGITLHEHGTACHNNCPTCHGRAA
jgi:hypothetical protein